MPRYVVPAAKLVDADLLKLVVPEIAEADSGRKKFKTAAKLGVRQSLRKQFASCSRKPKETISGKQLAYGRQASRIIPTKSANQPVGRGETFLETFLNDRNKQISETIVCGSFW